MHALQALNSLLVYTKYNVLMTCKFIKNICNATEASNLLMPRILRVIGSYCSMQLIE